MSDVSLPLVHQDSPLKGMGYAVLAYFLLAIMQVFGKLLSDHHHVIEIAFYRNAIALLPFLLFILMTGRRDILHIKPGYLKPVMLRSVFGTLSLIVTFAAFAAMPMADTTAFLFTSSLILPVLCIFFLGEKVGPYRWGAIIAGLIGAVIMAMPTGAVNSTGIILALSAASLHAVLGTLLRHLGKSEKPETITFYFLLIGLILTAVAMPWVAVLPAPELIPWLIGLGLSGAAAQFCLSLAFKYAPAALVTIFNYTGIIWATLFGWYIWSDWPTWPIWIGGGIVILSNLYIVVREQRNRHAN
jgi:drug/metabolite transporter (DMT)-like permease